MRVEELFTALLTEFPTLAEDGRIFYDHIEVQDGDELAPPYIVLTETEQDPFFADDTVFYLTIKHTIEIYTVLYDSVMLAKVERFLNGLKVPFTSNVEWLEDLSAYCSTFEVELDNSEVEES